jgi:hypothetical protein
MKKELQAGCLSASSDKYVLLNSMPWYGLDTINYCGWATMKLWDLILNYFIILHPSH